MHNQPEKDNVMTLKELKTMVEMIHNMPDETEIVVEIPHYGGGVSEVKLETAFMTASKSKYVKLYTEVL